MLFQSEYNYSIYDHKKPDNFILEIVNYKYCSVFDINYVGKIQIIELYISILSCIFNEICMNVSYLPTSIYYFKSFNYSFSYCNELYIRDNIIASEINVLYSNNILFN